MKTTHGGRRDNHKRRPDDKRGGVRVPGPGKTLGRPRKDKNMTTTMYLRNAKEIAIAARVAKGQGYITSIRDIKSSDRYVTNICARLAGGDSYARRDLQAAIVEQVGWERHEND